MMDDMEPDDYSPAEGCLVGIVLGVILWVVFAWVLFQVI